MRSLCLAFLLAAMCASPVTLAAQRGGGQGRGGGRGQGQMRPDPRPGIPTMPSSTTTQPSINRPSFPVDGLNRPSFPVDGLNRPSFPVDGLNRPSFPLNGPPGMGPPAPSPFAARPQTFAPRVPRSRGSRSYGVPLGYGFGLPSYPEKTTSDTRPATSEPEIVNGILYLDVAPRTALVFIDTAYVGTVDDLLFTGVALSRGRHWLELEALDYEKKLIEINITPGQPLRYRVELAPVRRAALTVIPSRPPETMYAIPGCYGGNRPPVAATLPPGCDIAKVRVLRPPQRAQ